MFDKLVAIVLPHLLHPAKEADDNLRANTILPPSKTEVVPIDASAAKKLAADTKPVFSVSSLFSELTTVIADYRSPKKERVSASYSEEIPRIYQGDLPGPKKLCRHAVLTRKRQELKARLEDEGASPRVAKKLAHEAIPSDIYNSEVKSVVPWEDWPFHGGKVVPKRADLAPVVKKIVSHLENNCSAAVYVSTSHGIHVVEVDRYDKTSDGKVAGFHFVDPASPQKTEGYLTWNGTNYVKDGSPHRKTAYQPYQLLGLYPTKERELAAVANVKSTAIAHETTVKPQNDS